MFYCLHIFTRLHIFRAGKIDRVDLEVDLDQRSVQSDQPHVKRARINSETSEDFG